MNTKADCLGEQDSSTDKQYYTELIFIKNGVHLDMRN